MSFFFVLFFLLFRCPCFDVGFLFFHDGGCLCLFTIFPRGCEQVFSLLWGVFCFVLLFSFFGLCILCCELWNTVLTEGD